MTVPKIISTLHAVAETTDAKRVRSLPARLDAAACLDVLAAIGSPHAVAAAIGEHMTIKDIDAALAETSLGTEDRMRFKYALVQHGILARGKQLNYGRGV
jgi:hypothetical protein